jgi:demethylmenaquinone methyltransferase/2-methoxy-6-polyprenyl-1,4-benzoquinol methylase
VAQLRVPQQGLVLDIATGTCDVALQIAAATDPSVRIVGEDFTQGMLVHGQKKLDHSPLGRRIMLVNAPCEAIPHPDCRFDAITIAFGIRNVVEREQGLREMLRVLKPGGRAVILEFSNPRSRLFRSLYYFYFRHLLPAIGGLFSQRSAYQYLPDSVLEFPAQEDFTAMMDAAGFVHTRFTDLTFGIATVYVGDKNL